MMKSILDDLHPEPWPKMWQKFDVLGIVRKEFVPPGKTVNGNFYSDVLRRLRENIQHKLPVKWWNNSWALRHDNAPAHASLIVWQFLASTKMTVIPHPPYSPDLATCDFFLFPKMNLKLKGWLFTALKRSRMNCRMYWRHWHKITSSSACDNVNPAGIALSMQKGTTLNGKEVNRDFSKWLSYFREILGNFGLHLVQPHITVKRAFKVSNETYSPIQHHYNIPSSLGMAESKFCSQVSLACRNFKRSSASENNSIRRR
jgi:Transposase.